MTREELEAIIWRQLTALGVDRRATSPAHVRTILAAADDYAFDASVDPDRLTALRRSIIARAS